METAGPARVERPADLEPRPHPAGAASESEIGKAARISPRGLHRSRHFNSAIAAAFRARGFAYWLAGLVAAASLGAAQAGPSDQQIDLSKYRGQVVYIDFWASWCGPCKLSFPYMQRMVSYYRHDKFVVIAVNVDHQKSKADAFLREVDNTLPVVYDSDSKIAKRFHVIEMPTSILIDKAGRVRFVHKGFFDEMTPQYEAHIMELLNEK